MARRAREGLGGHAALRGGDRNPCHGRDVSTGAGQRGVRAHGEREGAVPRRADDGVIAVMPAFLVHGVPDTHRPWAPLRARLRRTDVIAPSLPGFGCPLPAGLAASREGYVHWLAREIERLRAPVG